MSTTPRGTDRQTAARAHLWGHFTRQSAWEHGVPTIVRGEGHHVWDDAGHRLIDGLSGLFVVQLGHGREELAAAAAAQARELAFVPGWSYAPPGAGAPPPPPAPDLDIIPATGPLASTAG